MIVRVMVFGMPYQSGWASTMVTISFFGGLNLLAIGIVGLYVAQVFSEVKGRPCIVKEVRSRTSNAESHRGDPGNRSAAETGQSRSAPRRGRICLGQRRRTWFPKTAVARDPRALAPLRNHTMLEEDRVETRARYAARFREFGYDPRTLGWHKGRQRVRFAAALEAVGTQFDSLLDVGCGFGDLFGYLRERGWQGNYLGLDICPELLDEGT